MSKIFAPIKLSENISKTPEGFLLCLDVAITRVGELVYAAGETPIEAVDGRVIVERTEEDVFDKGTIASFEGKPLTVNHPNEFVNPDNWSDLAVGHIQNVRRGSGEDSDKLLADILVTDAVTIGLIDGGLREVSCGYDAEYIQTAKGRGRQSDIVGNHLALVDKGRAGASCAIMDHEGKGIRMTFKEKFLSKLGKTFDEAMKEDESKKEAKDEGVQSYDELVKMVKDIGEKLDGMKPEAKDAKEDDKPKQETEGKDEEAGEAGIESRLAKLEKAVAQLLQSESGDEDMESEDEDMEMGDTDEEDQTVDEDMPGMTGDSLSRAEILSPGIKKSKDIKVKALKAFYATKDGEGIVKALNGGKAPAFDSAQKVAALFVAASEVVKAQRKGNLSNTKRTQARDTDTQGSDVGKPMTAEMLNQKLANHYKK